MILVMKHSRANVILNYCYGFSKDPLNRDIRYILLPKYTILKVLFQIIVDGCLRVRPGECNTGSAARRYGRASVSLNSTT